MPKPVTPMCACDTFVLNDEEKILLVKRSDDGTWALPGGCQDLGETPTQCAVREAREESGYEIEITGFLGIFSSMNYKYVYYTWKDNQFVHMLFSGKVVGGTPQLSEETTEIGWFGINELPLLLDGHLERIRWAMEKRRNPSAAVHYE